MTALQREPLSSVRDEIAPLLQLHYEEIAHFQDIPLNPDWAFYEGAEKNGVLRIFTARDMGRLVGYGVFFVRRAAHYSSSLQAAQDILFVLPEWRGTSVGPRLIQFCDNVLRSEGVQVVYQHVKAAHDFGPLLQRLGYQLVDHIYARRLDHGSSGSSIRV